MPIRLAYEEEPVRPPARPAPAETAIDFDAAARVADPRDNCAIATQDLPAGATLSGGGSGGPGVASVSCGGGVGPGGASLSGGARPATLRLSVSILEGHRFALVPIAAHEFLLSWGEPFGRALRAITWNESSQPTRYSHRATHRSFRGGCARSSITCAFHVRRSFHPGVPSRRESGCVTPRRSTSFASDR